MRILVIGSGGREHALAWKLAQSSRVTDVFVAPGNGGTEVLPFHNVVIAVDDIPTLVTFAQKNAIDLTVVGPELPLVAGVVDAFQAAGLCIFGPTQAAAQLEGSKAFAKQFMVEEGIPTAPSATFTDYAAAMAYLAQVQEPVVVKADGLAAGKGVLVCDSRAEAKAALKQIMVERAFGAAGDKVLIEVRLEGEETSLLAFCDGTTVVPMLPARDYKRVLDGDAGLNTGGMGGYCPSPRVTPELVDEVTRRVLQPAVDGMQRRGTPYVGVLYAGIMLTAQGPRVLEFNCRFGDPETQLLMPLLETDLVDIMLACVEGRLYEVNVIWKPLTSVGVVLASGGYPGKYAKGKPITLTPSPSPLRRGEPHIFHAGTQIQNGQLVTSGGRVLAIVATAPTLTEARERAYADVAHVQFEGMQYRTDIATNVQMANGKWQMADLSPSSVKSVQSVESVYAAAGVSIDAGEKAVELMKTAVRRTYTPEVLGGIGAFGGSISVEALAREHNLVLVATADGVGTKTMIAEQMGVYDTVGHDIVNHCVNDILVQGARPLIFLDYIAAAKLDPVQIATVVGGCAAACEKVGCVLIGGETAEMPGVYREGSFDLVGTMVGWVAREKLLDGSAVQPGDICLGIPSSGLHTNGFSLARYVFRDVGWETVLPELGKPLGEVLLTPHRPYLREVEALWDAGVTIRAMSHLTGGSFIENIPRVLPDGVGARIDRAAWDVPAIFRLIQERGKVDTLEMHRVFNMGIGMVVIVPPEDVDAAMAVVTEAKVIGKTVAWDGAGARIYFS